MNINEIDQNFFGRKDILDIFKKRVIHLKEGARQNVALLGNSYLGKTSILQHFCANLDDNGVVPVYLDLENRDFNSFLTKFIGSLLYNFSRNRNIPVYDDLSLLIESCRKHIPQTIEVVQKVLEHNTHGKTAEAFSGLMYIPEIFTIETDKFCVLILDEFQHMESFPIENIFQELGKKIMTQKKCFYILASSFETQAKMILAEKLSLLFGNFEIIDVGAFDFQTALMYIEKSLKNVKIGIQLRNFLNDFTGGHPLYLNLICRELAALSAIHQQQEIYMPLLAQAVENTLFDRWGVISRHFDLIINDVCSGKGNRVVGSVLASMSNGKCRLEDILKDVDIKKNILLQKITRLLELGLIVRNSNFYYIKDKLFRYWVKYVYNRRVCDVEFVFDKQRKQFKEEFNRSIENFKVASRQDFSSRIVELLHCFDNESIDLNGRRYRLPMFREMDAFKIKTDHGHMIDVIHASNGECSWYVVARKESFTEMDIQSVVEEAKNRGLKPEKILIVSLANLDENTRLRALQEKCWIWSEDELSTLLSLFDKPFISR